MDRKTHTPEETQKRFDQLPLEVQDLLYSHKMLGILQQVGTKNQLHIDQLGVLEMETGQVMLGFTETKDYPEALMSSLNIDKRKADAIAEDINTLLFSKIRDALKQGPKEVVSKISTPPAATTSFTEKSVVMPSSVSKPSESTAVPAPAAPVKPASFAAMPHIDAMLTTPTVSMTPEQPAAPIPTTPSVPAPSAANGAPPQPGPEYKKTDPYHEPID